MCRYKKSSSKGIFKAIAICAAIAGGLVAVGIFLKRRAEMLNHDLDFDGDLYFEDDEYTDDAFENPDSCAPSAEKAENDSLDFPETVENDDEKDK